MRVISQNSICDIPYDHFRFYIDEGNIIAVSVGDEKSKILMAEYSSDLIAIRAMKKLQLTYAGEREMYNFGKDSDRCYFRFPNEGAI